MPRVVLAAAMVMMVTMGLPGEMRSADIASATPMVPECGGQVDQNCWHNHGGGWWFCGAYRNFGPFHFFDPCTHTAVDENNNNTP